MDARGRRIAVEHYASLGGVEVQGKEATWVAREHMIEYFVPAFVGEEIEIKTWMENIRRGRELLLGVRCTGFRHLHPDHG